MPCLILRLCAALIHRHAAISGILLRTHRPDTRILFHRVSSLHDSFFSSTLRIAAPHNIVTNPSSLR